MGLIKNLYTSKPILYALLALTAVGLLFNPLMALPKMMIFAMMTFTALVVGARLTAKGAKSAWSLLGASVNSQEDTKKKQEKVDQVINSMDNGKDLDDPMIKALVNKLRDNGLTVTTNWDVAKQVIEALPEKYSHLSENRDNVRGFVYKGKVFINPEKTDLSVPIHEYTHIWAEALRQNNMDEWQNIVSLLKKETQLWADTKKNYPYLETDDEIADEVLAQYSGSYGADKLKAFIVEGDKPKTVFKNLFKALEEFWKHIAKMFDCHFKKTDEIADRVLYDMMRGYNPQRDIDQHISTLSDNKPLPNGPSADISQQQKEHVEVATMVTPGDEAETAKEKSSVILTPPVEQKAGQKLREDFYDPLLEWVKHKSTFDTHLRVFSLTRNGEHVGYAASYIANGYMDIRKIDDSLGKQYFDTDYNKDHDAFKKISNKILEQSFIKRCPEYDYALRGIAGLIEEMTVHNQSQFHYDDYAKLDRLLSVVEQHHLNRNDIYHDLHEMIDEIHRSDNIYYLGKLPYDVHQYANGFIEATGKDYKTYNIPVDVVKAYARAVNDLNDTPTDKVFNAQGKAAFLDFSNRLRHENLDIKDALNAVKQTYWYRRANICIPQDTLDNVDAAMCLAAGFENPGQKVKVDRDGEKLVVDGGFIIEEGFLQKTDPTRVEAAAKEGYLFKVGYSGNRQPIYAIGNKMDDGHDEFKVVCGQDILDLKDGSKTIQHIRDMYWPEQRLDKVVTAVLERANDSTAQSFTDEQKKDIRNYTDRYHGAIALHTAIVMARKQIHRHPDAADIYKDWLDDAIQEFNDLASGKERPSHQDKSISY